MPAGAETAKRMLKLFLTILDTIGLLYKSEKTEDSATAINYLDIRLDIVNMSALVPQAKRSQIMRLLKNWENKLFIKLSKLQSIIGTLMWVTQVAPHGRVFIQ